MSFRFGGLDLAKMDPWGPAPIDSPPTDTMAFFTTDFSNASIFSAWTKRKNELRASHLQPYSDILYELVKDDILARRKEIHADLHKVISTARYPSEFSVPLWTYCTTFYSEPRHTLTPAVASETDAMVKRNGYEWYIGYVRSTEPQEWDAMWRWRDPQPVHHVVRFTDFLQRLSLLFGTEQYRVSYQVVSQKFISKPTELVVQKVSIMLHYHPKGVYGKMFDKLRAAAVKYESYPPPDLLNLLQPYVWKGVVEQEPGFSNRTPPPPPVPDAPPPLARRSNGGGIQHYEGPDALEEAARDLVREFDAECYCGYHHDEED